MFIWVDADSCPVDARKILERFSLRLAIPLRYVANHPIPLLEGNLRPAGDRQRVQKNPLYEMIITDAEDGAADDYIVEHIASGDIAVTRDIPLAARLVEKGAIVLNDRGMLFTAENIRERLSLRDFNLALTETGCAPDKTAVYNKRDINNFANCLDRVLTKCSNFHHN
jgi:uncharacterized protein YaiI (UPF0178 family)